VLWKLPIQVLKTGLKDNSEPCGSVEKCDENKQLILALALGVSVWLYMGRKFLHVVHAEDRPSD
jgi:hypothetical protein